MEGKEQTFETAETDDGPESSHPRDLEEDSSSEGSADGYDELNDLDCFGIEAIDRACMLLYPDQPNPIQAEAVMKYWLGGPHPLDYISMYSNDGDENLGVPPHWHYITYGFTDLHGDDRVHSYTGRGMPSGFGFELTFRLKKVEGEQTAPMWPTSLLNKLAAYVFHTGNVLHVGDHIPWHQPLDGMGKSRIQHMLVAEEPQLLDLDTPYGIAQFRQIVGVTDEEVKSAQRWKGAGILELLAKDLMVGPYFITDLARDQSIFDCNPSLVQLVDEGIERDGSNLGHVTALCAWFNMNEEALTEAGKGKTGCGICTQVGGGEAENQVFQGKREKVGSGDKKGGGDSAPAPSSLPTMDIPKNKDNIKQPTSGMDQPDNTLKAESNGEQEDPSPGESTPVTPDEEQPVFVNIDAIHLLFDSEAAELLPLIVKGRLGKGRFFIFHNAEGQAIHFVPPELASQENIVVSPEEPMKCSGQYLQLFCSNALMDEIMEEFGYLQNADKTKTGTKDIKLKELPITIKVLQKGGPLNPQQF